MAKENYLVLDIGTTDIKGLVFDKDLNLKAQSYKGIKSSSPQSGWIEQNPNEIISISRQVLQKVISDNNIDAESLVALGITTQRETTICWDRTSGQLFYPAIVWSDSRTTEICQTLKPQEQSIREKTGLPLDPYFSASKLAWIIKNANINTNALFGTVDTWALWNLTEEQSHLTDYTNASRTLLFNIRDLNWDTELLNIFGIKDIALPEVLPSQGNFGTLKKDILGISLPIVAICGDQQASMRAVGVERGLTKITYGTGTFIMQIIGSEFSLHDKFFTTLAVGERKPVYALEAKVGRHGQKIAELLKEGKPLDVELMKIAEQVNEYVSSLPIKPEQLVIDGGISQAKNLQEIQENISQIPVIKQKIYNGTALGVAKLIQQQ